MTDNDIQTFKAIVFKAVDDYAHGRLLLFELCDRIGAPFPSDKKVHTLAQRVKELEAEVAASKQIREVPTHSFSSWAGLGDRVDKAEAEAAGLKDGNKHLLDLSMELQERVAYAEKDRDEALKEKDEALAKAKEKSDRTGKHVGKIVKAVRGYYKGALTEAELAHAVCAVAVDLGVPKPEGRFAIGVEQTQEQKLPPRIDWAGNGVVNGIDMQGRRVFNQDGSIADAVAFKDAFGHEPQPKCSHCNDSGVIETGNNDLPCEHCPQGRTAVFNTMDGRQTGEQMVTQEFGRPMPAAWKKES